MTYTDSDADQASGCPICVDRCCVRSTVFRGHTRTCYFITLFLVGTVSPFFIL